MEHLYCITPFTDFTINSTTIHPCTCRIWVNPKYYTAHDINTPGDTQTAWNSIPLHKFRHNLRCEDHTICDRANCPVKNLKSVWQLRHESIGLPKHIANDIANFLEFKNSAYDNMPTKVHLAYDYSCNLKCITCRNHYHSIPATMFLFPYTANVINFIKQAYVLTITDTADPIASPHYRYLLQNELPLRNDFDHITLMTNGVLFDENFYDTIFYKNYLKTVSISIDAMTKNTYDRIRLGGDWNRLQHNIEFIKTLKNNRLLNKVYVNFVIQKCNLEEATDFTLWAMSCGFDGVNFNMPMFWDTDVPESFIDSISVHKPSYTSYHKFESIVHNISKLPIETIFAFPPHSNAFKS